MDLYEHVLPVQNNPYAGRSLFQIYNDSDCDRNPELCRTLDIRPRNDVGGTDRSSNALSTYHHDNGQKMGKNAGRDYMCDVRMYLNCNNLAYIHHTLVRKESDGGNDHRG